MDSDSNNECILCVQPINIIGLGHCNHKPFCYSCVIKLRVISKAKACPICKQGWDKVILTDNLNAQFQDYDIKSLRSISSAKDYKDFYYVSEEVKQTVDNLSQFQCLVPNCQAEVTSFKNIVTLKQHLRDIHHRFLCDTCLEQKTCFLSEQLLYSEYQLRKHVNHGDTDEDGNLIFKHPYCKYCNKHFYDEDKFKTHLYQAHIKCDMCEENKYTFYRDHGSYERHLKMSHYLCEEPQCKDMLQVFKTQGELEYHRSSQHMDKYHKKTNQQNLQYQFFSETSQTKKKGQLNDQEGWDFSDQFISLHKTNMRAIVLLDDHKDELIDFREFYYADYNDDYDRNCDHSESDHGQRVVNLEDLHFYKPHNMPSMNFDSFLKKCGRFLKDKKQEEELRRGIQKLEQDVYPPSNFVNDFIRNLGPKTGFRLLSFYQAMRDVRECKQRHKLVDEAILVELKKMPRKINNIIFKSKTYSELFEQLLEQLNKNIETRIQKKLLVKYVDTTMPKERIFQLIEILRHVRTSEMGKFKFASNFGLHIDTLDHIRTKVLLKDLNELQENLLIISNLEMPPFYLYVNLCNKILKGEQVHKEKKDVNECVYSEFLSSNQALLKQLETPENVTHYEIVQRKKVNPTTERGIEFDDDDFPTIPKPKQQQLQQQQQQQQFNSKWVPPSAVVLQQGKKQDIDEMFPSMEPVQGKGKKKWKQQQQKPQFSQQLNDDDFEPISGYQPNKTIEGTAWDNNPIIPKKNTQMKVLGEVKKKNGKVSTLIAGGFF